MSMNGFDLSALAGQARQPAPRPTEPPPVDPGNQFLSWTAVKFRAELVELGDGENERPNIVQAVPGEIQVGSERRKVVIFTVRTPSTTVTVFWSPEEARERITTLRTLAAAAPAVLRPPSTAPRGPVPFMVETISDPIPPDLQRIRATLDGPDGTVVWTMDSTRVTAIADIMERTVMSLAGLTLPPS
jgi:hypothetical protein